MERELSVWDLSWMRLPIDTMTNRSLQNSTFLRIWNLCGRSAGGQMVFGILGPEHRESGMKFKTHHVILKCWPIIYCSSIGLASGEILTLQTERRAVVLEHSCSTEKNALNLE